MIGLRNFLKTLYQVYVTLGQVRVPAVLIFVQVQILGGWDFPEWRNFRKISVKII
jgi:hypothetical protein